MIRSKYEKRLLLTATITVFVTGLILASTLNNVEANQQKHNSSTVKLKCTLFGSFLNSENDNTIASAGVSAGTGSCNKMKNVGSLGSLIPVGEPMDPDGAGVDYCLPIASPPGGSEDLKAPSMIFDKKGKSVLFHLYGYQCFFDDNHNPVDVLTPFCGDETNIHFSESELALEVISDPSPSQYQSTQKFDDATGSGEVKSWIKHCDTKKPLANWFKTKVKIYLEIP